MKINLDIRVGTTPPPTEEPKKKDVVWPTFIPAEDAGIPAVDFQFFDGSTVFDEDNKVWKRIDGWVQQPSLRSTSAYTYNHGCIEFITMGETHETQFVMNDPGPAESVIAAEYGESNKKKRWKRMPLVEDIQRDDLKRADTQSNPDICLRVGLTQEDRAVFDYSLDMTREGYAKGPKPTIFETPQEADGSFIIRDNMVPQGTYGIKFWEDGSKFINHYVDSTGSGGDINPNQKYTAQLSKPTDGLYWRPFDTSDAENFKVTLEPSFDADDVGGRILHAFAGRQKVKLYLMPKDWVYFLRFTREMYATGEIAECAVGGTTETIGKEGHGDYFTTSTFDWCGQVAGRWDIGCSGGTVTPEMMHDGFDGWNYSGDAGWGEGCSCDIDSGIFACTGGQGWTDPWRRSPWGCNASEHIISGVYYGTCTYDHHVDFSNSWCCTKFWKSMTLLHFKHRILALFGPPPFAFGAISGGGEPYWTDNNQIFQHRNNTGLIGDEGIERAITNRTNYYKAQGMSAGEADTKARGEIFCGYTSYQCIIDSYMKDVTNNWKYGGNPMGWQAGADSAVKWAIWSFFLYTTPLVTHHYTHEGVTPYDVTFGQFWWDWGFDFMNLDNPPVPANLPIGMGVAASLKGTLCAVILVNDSRVYYVWRKTDEDFTLYNSNLGPGGGIDSDKIYWPSPEGFPNAEAEGVIPHPMLLAFPAWCTGMNGGECQFWGSNGAITHVGVPYDIYCKTVSGTETCTAHKIGGPSYQFTTTKGGHPKIYPIFPRETPPGLGD